MTTRSQHKTKRDRRPSKLSLLMMGFFLQPTVSAKSSTFKRRDGWRPESERPGAPFVLGQGKGEGVKVVGYEGEWPLWSEFHAKQIELDNASKTKLEGSTASKVVFVCMAVGECSACPQDVIHFPYCRPYNNRRRVACQQVIDPSQPASIQKALLQAPKSDITGWEACGKSPKSEARDYFELIAWMAGIAMVSIYIFIHRQKVLFQRQTDELQSRVSGRQQPQQRRKATLS